MTRCPATYEAVREHEDETGESCPLCDRPACEHDSEDQDVWNPARARSGVAATRQDFRHSYVSLMRAAGVDPADLAYWTGHTVLTATTRYTHSTGSSAAAARRAVG